MFVEQMNISLNAIVWTHESWIVLHLSRVFLCLLLARAGFTWLMHSDHVYVLNLTGMGEGGVQDLYLERCFITIWSSHFPLCFCSFFSLLLDCQLPEGRSHQVSSVAQLCLTLCNPMDCSTPGFPVHRQLLEFTQTHVHWVSDAFQPSHPPSPPSPPAFNLSQHRDLFQWVSSSHQAAKALELQLQHQSFQWIFNIDFL